MVEYQREKNLPVETIINEAMSEAMVRKCNKCGLRFLKTDGCNKMKCRCGNMQCFVCSKNVDGYDHFSDGKRGSKVGCPMYCDADKLLEKDVIRAKLATEQRLRQGRAGFPRQGMKRGERGSHSRHSRDRVISWLSGFRSIQNPFIRSTPSPRPRD